MGKSKKSKQADAAPGQPKVVCFFCEQEFAEEGLLILHQQTKHFKCTQCSGFQGGRCPTHGCRHKCLVTLSCHWKKDHKGELKTIPGSKEGRDDPMVFWRVHGVGGTPDDFVSKTNTTAAPIPADFGPPMPELEMPPMPDPPIPQMPLPGLIADWSICAPQLHMAPLPGLQGDGVIGGGDAEVSPPPPNASSGSGVPDLARQVQEWMAAKAAADEEAAKVAAAEEAARAAAAAAAEEAARVAAAEEAARVAAAEEAARAAAEEETRRMQEEARRIQEQTRAVVSELGSILLPTSSSSLASDAFKYGAPNHFAQVPQNSFPMETKQWEPAGYETIQRNQEIIPKNQEQRSRSRDRRSRSRGRPLDRPADFGLASRSVEHDRQDERMRDDRGLRRSRDRGNDANASRGYDPNAGRGYDANAGRNERSHDPNAGRNCALAITQGHVPSRLWLQKLMGRYGRLDYSHTGNRLDPVRDPPWVRFATSGSAEDAMKAIATGTIVDESGTPLRAVWKKVNEKGKGKGDKQDISSRDLYKPGPGKVPDRRGGGRRRRSSSSSSSSSRRNRARHNGSRKH